MDFHRMITDITTDTVARVFAEAARREMKDTNLGGLVNVTVGGEEFSVIIGRRHLAHIFARQGYGPIEYLHIDATPEQDRPIREAFRAQHGRDPR
ncbi:hypothetical protein [Actinomadura miaoliensis]|uniref:Uncharacterized protein n=1 Tax=Actinomadura miaoliensis TaxID=430685 RepID=A0ABP7WCS0_9ACTN